MTTPSFSSRVYQIVKQIPRGKVSTYGHIALLAGSPNASRAVGFALHKLHGDDLDSVPWQRVINAAGKISAKGDYLRADIQKKLLQKEGVKFNKNDCIDLELYFW